MAQEGQYEHDAEGILWYHFSDGRRIRAVLYPCAHCGEEIRTNRGSTQGPKYCSQNCKNSALHPPIETLASNCPNCGRQYFGRPKQVYCSHTCAAAKMHADGDRTTSVEDTPESLINSDNPRYSQDESGQWWYTPGGSRSHNRSRAYIAKCPICSKNFLKPIFHRDQVHCGKSCARLAIRDEISRKQKGSSGSNWKGGRRIDHRGYVLLWAPDHPSRANTAKPYVFEHRLVMEKRLGRFLQSHENVHHINGQRDDNRDENLELWSTWQPCGQRVEDKMKWVWEMVDLYEHLHPRHKPA